MSQTYLILYRPGPAWKVGKPAAAQPTPEHGHYLLDLYKQGHLRFAGPFGDDTGAALVLEAADETQARKLVEADPAVVQAIFLYELHPWTLVPWAQYAAHAKTQRL